MAFRKDFIWGAATAAYQIEGAACEDGKGLSVWDVFSHEPDKIYRGHTGDIACDHYHRYKDDVALMQSLGVKNYRFSISWPRVIPEGMGQANEKGLDFYDRLIDELLAHGIRPFVTLFHWDYPNALQARGAWENPDSPSWFADYASLVARRFGDRVKDFITFNEPQCFIGLGYANAQHAPGLRMPPSSTVPMAHNVLKAHGLATQALHQIASNCRVGYAPCGDARIPASDSPADIEAARRAYFDIPSTPDRWSWNVSWWSDPALLGSYPEHGMPILGRYLPAGWEKDLEVIHQPLEFYAQNIYNGVVVRAADNEAGYEQLLPPVGSPKTACQWMINPEALYWGSRYLYERYRTPFLITENGMSCHDAVSLDGQVHDPNRQDYIHRYLLAYKRAAEDGVDALGYFVWSLLDNLEWNSGYNERFGIVHVDFATQKRTVKDSARWYKTVIESNGENL